MQGVGFVYQEDGDSKSLRLVHWSPYRTNRHDFNISGFSVSVLRFRVSPYRTNRHDFNISGFRVSVLGFRVSPYRTNRHDLKMDTLNNGHRVSGLGFTYALARGITPGFGPRVWSLRLRTSSFGYRV